MNEEWDTLVDWLQPYFKSIPLQGVSYAFHLFTLFLGWSVIRTIVQHNILRRGLLLWCMGNTRQTKHIQRRCIWSDILWSASMSVFWLCFYNYSLRHMITLP